MWCIESTNWLTSCSSKSLPFQVVIFLRYLNSFVSPYNHWLENDLKNPAVRILGSMIAYFTRHLYSVFLFPKLEIL